MAIAGGLEKETESVAILASVAGGGDITGSALPRRKRWYMLVSGSDTVDDQWLRDQPLNA